MLHADLVIATCLGYVAILFGVAFAGDRRARRDPGGWLASPMVYTLSISIYCTSWTFFGAVGSAARSGLEFVTIYLGPTIVFVGWWVFLRKLVTVGRVHHITSIADFISARFGKSPALGALVTVRGAGGDRALHRAAAQGADRELPGHHLPRRRGGGCEQPARARLHGHGLARRRPVPVFDHVRRAQHRRERAPPRRHRRDRARGRRQARGPPRDRHLGRRPRRHPGRGLRSRAPDPDRARGNLRRAVDHAPDPRRRGGDLPAAAVPSHRRPEHQRGPDPHRLVAVPALSLAHHPLRRADRAGRTKAAARRLGP